MASKDIIQNAITQLLESKRELVFNRIDPTHSAPEEFFFKTLRDKTVMDIISKNELSESSDDEIEKYINKNFDVIVDTALAFCILDSSDSDERADLFKEILRDRTSRANIISNSDNNETTLFEWIRTKEKYCFLRNNLGVKIDVNKAAEENSQAILESFYIYFFDRSVKGYKIQKGKTFYNYFNSIFIDFYYRFYLTYYVTSFHTITINDFNIEKFIEILLSSDQPVIIKIRNFFKNINIEIKNKNKILEELNITTVKNLYKYFETEEDYDKIPPGILPIIRKKVEICQAIERSVKRVNNHNEILINNKKTLKLLFDGSAKRQENTINLPNRHSESAVGEILYELAARKYLQYDKKGGEDVKYSPVEKYYKTLYSFDLSKDSSLSKYLTKAMYNLSIDNCRAERSRIKAIASNKIEIENRDLYDYADPVTNFKRDYPTFTLKWLIRLDKERLIPRMKFVDISAKDKFVKNNILNDEEIEILKRFLNDEKKSAIGDYKVEKAQKKLLINLWYLIKNSEILFLKEEERKIYKEIDFEKNNLDEVKEKYKYNDNDFLILVNKIKRYDKYISKINEISLFSFDEFRINNTNRKLICDGANLLNSLL